MQVTINNVAILKNVCQKLGYKFNEHKMQIEGNLYRPAIVKDDKIIFDSIDRERIEEILNEYAYEEIMDITSGIGGFVVDEVRNENEIILEIEI
jgi:hypothetical protein